MSRYRKVYVHIWGDEKFQEWDQNTRLLWIYLITSEQTNRIGLYRFSAGCASEETGLSMASIRRSFAVIEKSGRVSWNKQRRLLWIPTWLKYNRPHGANLLKSFMKEAQDFADIDEGKAILALLQIFQATSGSSMNGVRLNRREAIFIRDRGICVYCDTKIVDWNEYEVDHILPVSRGKSREKNYENVVCSCKSCNQKKRTKTAEEFGFPFLSGRQYSIRQALVDLAFDTELRGHVRSVFNKLPSILENIEESTLQKVSKFGWRPDVVITPYEHYPDTDATQEQEQEQEQYQEQNKEKSPPTAGAAASDKPTKRGSGNNVKTDMEAFVELWNSIPGFCKCIKTTKTRTSLFQTRLKDSFWKENWKAAFKKASTLPALSGANNGNWKAEIDWFLRPDTVVKILEGKYDNWHLAGANGRSSKPPSPPQPSKWDDPKWHARQAKIHDLWDRQKREAKENGKPEPKRPSEYDPKWKPKVAEDSGVEDEKLPF